MVPFILGVPSVKAQVIGESGDGFCYVLHQEYDTQNDNGEWIHVTKNYYREKWFIESYWMDNAGASSGNVGHRV